MAAPRTRSGDASLVALSVRAADETDPDEEPAVSDWIRERVREPSYERFLKRVHGGSIAVGDEWEEFVSRGCGNPLDVIVRVEQVVDGDVLGPDTEIAIRPHRETVEG